MRSLSPEEKVTRLCQTDLFSEIDKLELLVLVKESREKFVRAGRFFWRRASKNDPTQKGRRCFKHEPEDALILVLKGSLNVMRGSMILRRIENDLIGIAPVAAFAPHTADLAAATDTLLLLIPGTCVRGLMEKYPALAVKIIARMAALIGKLSDELEERDLDLERRVARRILALAQGGPGRVPASRVRCTHAELAAMTGASRAAVSRAVTKLRRRGSLGEHKQDRFLEIASFDSLEAFASKSRVFSR